MSFSSDDVSSSASFDDSDDITLPPELLERERQLMERNRQLEARVKDLLRSTLEEPEEITPQTDELQVKQKFKRKSIPKHDLLPSARMSPVKADIIEVQVPIDVEPYEEVRVDPVPELREVFHKIAKEIRDVNSQIADLETSKTQTEVAISKFQADLKRVQIDSERADQSQAELVRQIDSAKAQITKLKNDINAARLTRMERVQKESDAKQKQAQMEQKIRRQKAAADRLQSELNTMQSTDSRMSKANSDKTKLKQQIDEQRKAIRQLKLLLSEIQRASAHEEKIFEHIQNGRDLTITSGTMERAIQELL